MEAQEAVMLCDALSCKDQLEDPLPPPAAETVVEGFAGSIGAASARAQAITQYVDDAAQHLCGHPHISQRWTWGRRA